MSKKDTIEMRTEAILEEIVKKHQVEIYDVEYGKEGSEWYLRAFIDKQGGVTIEDCEKVSRELSDELDRQDFIAEAYILEVSSPGLGRILKKDKHLEKSLMQEVYIKTYKPIENCKEFTGILKAYSHEAITIDTEEKEYIFAKSDIALIRLAFDF